MPDIISFKDTILCWDIIDYGFSERVINRMKEAVKDNMPITLLINSKGGVIYDSWVIIDIIKTLKLDVTTIGAGSIESAALLLFVVGTKGKRYLMPHTTLMCHNYTWPQVANPDYEDLKNRREIEDIFNEQLKDFYIEHTKLTKKTISKFLTKKDVFFDAKTAVEYGFADKIL